MRICFFGSGEFGLPTFDSLRNDGHEIVSIVTQPDRPAGRGKTVTPTPIKRAAQEKNLPVLDPANVNDPAVIASITALRADLAYVVAFGQKIGATLRETFPVGIVNLHASLLPAWRGAAPINWSILNADRHAGVSVFRLVEKMDAGPVLIQRSTEIGPDETADELHDRLSRIGCDAVRATLGLLSKDPGTPGAPQDESKVTLAPKLKKTDGYLRFDQGAAEISRRVRGLWSWPGASCRYLSADGRRDEIVTIAHAVPYQARPNTAATGNQCGRISDVLSVETSQGDLTIQQIKPAGGRLMTWEDFVNGRHVKPGDRFAPIEPQ
jgi:methionyl-tRNA formyltransferase